MGLPRHLQGKFNPADGSIIDNAPAGQSTTSDAPTDGQVVGQVAADPTPTPTPTPAPAPAPAPAEPATPAAPDEGATATPNADARDGTDNSSTDDSQNAKDANYARMEGRYKAQIERLKEQLTHAQEAARGSSTVIDMLAELRAENASLRAGSAPTGAASRQEVEAPAAPGFDLSPEESEMYGDFAPVAEKLVAKATAPLLAQIAKLEAATGAVDARVGQTGEALFMRDVRANVPAFDDITVGTRASAWQEYLNRRVPFTAMTIGAALTDAHNARDLERVKSIFNAFSSEHAPAPAATASTTADPATATSAPTTKPANGLAQFATPHPTSASSSGKPKPKFRNSDFAVRAQQMRMGQMSKSDFLKFETEFMQAKQAGLVSQE